MIALRLAAIAEVLLLVGCCSSQRFTHVEVEGTSPFMFFDQKTKQMCWAQAQSAKGSLVTVTITIRDNPAQVEVPVCKDLQ